MKPSNQLSTSERTSAGPVTAVSGAGATAGAGGDVAWDTGAAMMHASHATAQANVRRRVFILISKLPRQTGAHQLRIDLACSLIHEKISTIEIFEKFVSWFIAFIRFCNATSNRT